MAGPAPLSADIALDHAAAGAGPRPVKTADAAAARKSAQEFEAFFVAHFLEQMFAGIATDGMFGGGHAEGMFRSLQMQEYGRAIADAGGVGIADMVMREILVAQEEAR